MRRTPRSEFLASRRDADEARRALLARVRGDRETAPVAPAEPVEPGLMNMLNEAISNYVTPDAVFDRLNEIVRAARAAADRQANLLREDLAAAAERLRGVPYQWSAPVTGITPDTYRGARTGLVRAPYDPVVWPDEGYPCQLCWAVGRWPWEPMRSCPASVDVESTYCVKHGGQAAEPKPQRQLPVMANWYNFLTPSPSSQGLLQPIAPTWVRDLVE